jgi:hypothetical protein
VPLAAVAAGVEHTVTEPAHADRDAALAASRAGV